MRRRGLGDVIREGAGFKPWSQGVLRPAVVDAVNSVKGTVSLSWLDNPGGRVDVPITQSDWGVWCFPVPGTVVLVGFGIGDEAFITRVMPVKYVSQVSRQQTRKIFPGEKLLQSSGGSEIYMTAGGNIRLSDAFGQIWEMSRDSAASLFKADTVDFHTGGGALRFGTVRRETTGSRSSVAITRAVTVDGRTLDAGGVALSELRVSVTESEDDALGSVDDITSPIVNVTLGTKVSSSGSKETSDEDAEICLEIETTAGSGCKIEIDKAGNMKIEAGGKLKLECGDIEVGDSTMRALVDERIVNSYNTHTHASPGAPPAVLLVASQVTTSDTKAS